MEFTHPWLLLCLLLLPWLYYGYRSSLVDLPRFQQVMSLAIRCLILILLVLSATDLQYVKHHRQLAVVFLADLSDSISDAGIQHIQDFLTQAERFREDEQIGLLAFTDRIQILHDFHAESKSPLDLESIRAEWRIADEKVGDATHVAQAIESAWGLFPADANRRIVLLTDGLETHGNALHAALRGKDFGMQIDTVPIRPDEAPEVMVVGVEGPVEVKQGQPFRLDVVIHSNHEDVVEVRLFRNQFEVDKQEHPLKPGENRISFNQTVSESGTLTYDAVCRPVKDTRYDNNRAFGVVSVSGKPQVLLIDENETQARYLAQALEDAEIRVDVRNGLGVPSELSDLQNYDLVVFSDVAANRVGTRQMEALRSYVQDLGGGFMMLGSENSFGLGGYYKTPIEEALPVRTDTEKKKETPSLAMVLVIDKSGSMGGIKIELAKEASRATVDLLGRRDQIGVIAFDGSPHWIAEIHSASDKLYLEEQIRSLSAGGGTNLYPALEQAYLALTETQAKLKHVIVLSDGHSQSGDWYGIVSAMYAERITVSTVGIGSGADMNLLTNIANWGGGREYFTQDAYSIPQIFAKETVTASKSAIIDEPFIPQLVKPSQVLQGIDLDTAPFLLGYVATQPKPTAEVFLVSERGDPLLVSWQYGLGKSVAFTSDAKARWGADWLEWPGYAKFWTQLVRDTMRKSTSGDFETQIELAQDTAHLGVDALDDEGEFLNQLDGEVSVIAPDLSKQPVELRQTAPGKYESRFDTHEMGAYFVNILQKQHGEIVNQQVRGAVVSYPAEYRVSNADEALLKQIASVSGGKFDPTPGEVLRPAEQPIPIRVHLWRSFLVIAACLLLVDIALRRVALPSRR